MQLEQDAPEHASYMYHCHRLEHQDCSTMGPFTVTLALAQRISDAAAGLFVGCKIDVNMVAIRVPYIELHYPD